MIDKNGIKKRPLTRPNDLSDSKQRSEACHRRRLRRHCRRIRHRRHTYLDALDVVRKGRVACGKDHRAQRHRDDQHKYDKQKNVYPSFLYYIILLRKRQIIDTSKIFPLQIFKHLNTIPHLCLFALDRHAGSGASRRGRAGASRRGRQQSRDEPLLYSFRNFKFRASFVPVRPAAELG